MVVTSYMKTQFCFNICKAYHAKRTIQLHEYMYSKTSGNVDDFCFFSDFEAALKYKDVMPIVGVTDKDDYLSAIDKTLKGMIYHYKQKTKFDYYFIGDDDTFINFNNYYCLLEKLDKKFNEMYIGGCTGPINGDGRIHVTGGPGIIMNKKTFDAITPFIEKEYVIHTTYSDVSLALNVHLYNAVYHGDKIQFVELPEFLNPNLPLTDVRKIVTYHVRDTQTLKSLDQ